MRLRKPCEHNRYEAHWFPHTHDSTYPNCLGGEFLPEDTIVIEKVEGEWPENAAGRIGETGVDHRSNLFWGAKVRDGRKRLDGLASFAASSTR